MASEAIHWVRGMAGAAVGGAIGYVVTTWLASRGLYALVVPGGLLGAGCGSAAGVRSQARGLACAIAGLAVSVYTNWVLAPFVADESFVYFVKNIHKEQPMFLLMIVLGTLAAYWFGRDMYWGAPVARPRATDR